MLLSDIFEQLTYGELSNLSIGGKETGSGITTEAYPELMAHINLGLTELHKRFNLRLKETIIQQYQSINTYYLDYKYAVSNTSSVEPTKYLIDSVSDPFENIILKIEKVSDELGTELVLNTETDPDSLYTPEYNAIQIPNPVDTAAVGVIYRADHNNISHIGLDPKTTEVAIPISMLQPLLMFVASRAHAGMLVTDGTNMSQVYLAKFEAACIKVRELDLLSLDEYPNEKLWANRWV